MNLIVQLNDHESKEGSRQVRPVTSTGPGYFLIEWVLLNQLL